MHCMCVEGNFVCLYAVKTQNIVQYIPHLLKVSNPTPSFFLISSSHENQVTMPQWVLRRSQQHTSHKRRYLSGETTISGKKPAFEEVEQNYWRPNDSSHIAQAPPNKNKIVYKLQSLNLKKKIKKKWGPGSG